MSEEQAVKKGKGTVFVRVEICKGCSFCIDFCPTHCLEFSHELQQEGVPLPGAGSPPRSAPVATCAGLYCPDFAIFGIRFKDLEASRPPRPSR